MIDGAINANGQVIFVNPNGVVFGKGAQVNVGGLVATTMNIANDAFMNAKDSMTFEGGDTGKIVNKGRITIHDAKGFVALMAPEVKNEGVILASLSGQNSVALVSGQKVTLTFADRQLINVSVDASVINSLINNKRLIQTNGGQVLIAANSANDLMGSVINNKGSIVADGVSVQGGVVTLTASTINQTGTVSANSASSVGGNITMTAKEVNLSSTSKTTATGIQSGGQINMHAANTVNVNAGAIVNASATQIGNGGAINLNAPVINLKGQLSAQGGQQLGNGGRITTTASTLNVDNNTVIDASALNGQAGSWTINAPEINFDQSLANLVSATLNSTNVVINTFKNLNFALAKTASNMSGDINLATNVVLEKTSNILTSLTMNAEGVLNIGGTFNNTSSAPLDMVLMSSDSIILTSSAQLNARFMKLSAPILTAGGNLNAYGSSNPESPFMALLGGRLEISGTLRSGSKQNKGSIQIRGDNVVDINGANLVAANDDLGGDISIASNGDINISHTTILTNGSNGRGGSLNIFATNVAIFNSTLKANGTTGGGLVYIVASSGDVNFQQSFIQTNGGAGVGGSILISGVNNTIISSTEMDSTGYSQGGTIKIGNDATDQKIPFSSFTYIDSNSVLNASQLSLDPLNRHGGYIETSGHTLFMLASINAGRGGIWLLDPTDIVISYDSADSLTINYDVLNSFGFGELLPSDIHFAPLPPSINPPISALPSTINVNDLITALNLGQLITITTVGNNGVGNGDISVNAPIIATDGSLTLKAAGTVSINSPISLTGSASELYVKAALINISSNVTTTASQLYDGPVIISSTPTLTVSGNGSEAYLVFGWTVDGIKDGEGQLNLSNLSSGKTIFADAVGSTNRLYSLSVEGQKLQIDSSITTTNYQDYNVADIYLGGDVTMTTNNSSTISIYSFVNETGDDKTQILYDYSLTLDAGISGSIQFTGSIPDYSPIKDFIVKSPISISADINTRGRQTYEKSVRIQDTASPVQNGNVTYGLVTLSTPSIISFGSTLDSTYSGVSDLVIHGLGGIALSADVGGISTFHAMTFEGPVRLYDAVTINAADGDIHFTSTIDSDLRANARALTLNAGTGNIKLNDSLGYINPLGATEFNSPVIFERTTGCSPNCNLYVITDNQPITFNASADDSATLASRSDLILSAIGSSVNLFGALGANNPFKSLEIWGTVNMSSSVNSTGNQTYHNSVRLKEAVTMTTQAGDVVFKADVQGDAASVAPKELIQFLGNGDYIYQGTPYTADAISLSGTQIANVTFDSNANTYQWTPSYFDIVKVLAVAGGGAGGGSGGGGGGGGAVFNPRVSLAPNTTYTISVGAGGLFDPNGSPGSQGQNGNNSQFGTSIIALGGGGGGGCCWGGGNNGGSGGGASVYWYNWGWNGQPGTSGLGTLGQGNAGSSAAWVNGQFWMGGGGGGAGSSPFIPINGQNVSNLNSGNGGSGLASNITGTITYYGGGGGASPFYDWGSNPGSAKTVGGNGGGGAGGYITGNPGDQWNSANWVVGTAGIANTGGGGGAGPIVCCWNGPGAGSGGSGTVIIARPTYGQATDLTVNSGKAIIGIENISNINRLSLSSSSGSSTPVNVPLNLVLGTTSFTKGGTDTYVINGLGNYSSPLTVTGGVLSIINSPGNLLTIDTLVLNGGGLALDAVNSQDLVVNNLSTFTNSPITNAKTVTVNGVANLGSSITSSGDQYFANDVTLWSNTTLTSTNGNVVFGGKVLGYISTLQFLGNGDYLFQDPDGMNTNGTVSSASTLPGGFILSYDATSYQYGFTSAFSSQGRALVVAGGGAGALGGGGGGGVLLGDVTLNANTIYTVIVGQGGLTSNNGYYSGGNGGDSQFGSGLIAKGGGGGGSVVGQNGNGCCWMSGYAGGSGGGGAFWNWTQGGSGVPGQGYSGGPSTIGNGPYGQYWLAGGGGGAGGSPVNTGSNYTSSNQTGNGGIGLRSNITGAPTYFGGGGGGGSPDWNNPGTTGGSGGGGNGMYYNGSTWINPTAGSQNTGGGGGGGYWCCNAANGGSGIVVLNIGIAPNLTITAQPSANYLGILTGTNFSHIGVLTVNSSSNFSLNAASQIASSAGLAKMGSGTLTLNNSTSYAGSISVLGGTIVTPGLTGPLTMGSLYLANGGTFDLGTPSGQDLNLGSFTMVNGGNLLNINNLNVSGIASLSGNISTSGSQTYGGPVQISANVTVQTSGVAPITFNSTIDDVVAGTNTLTLNSGVSSTGMVNLNGVIGGTSALKSLTINGPASIGGAINTTGDQTYNGNIRLTADTAMTAVTGNIQINGNVLGDAFYPGIIQFLGNGVYAYQTLGVNNNSTYTRYTVGDPIQAPGVVVSYDAVSDKYTWTANYDAKINALIVGGGGAGSMGGGGGGGVIPLSSYATVAGTQYTVIVGAGGLVPTDCCGRAGGNGVDSKFGLPLDLLIAKGGGGGGGPYSNDGSQCCWFGGNSGGSGGGASFYTSNPGGLGSLGQGYNGSNSITVGTSNSSGQVWGYWQAGGGGGAGGTGPSQVPFVLNGNTWGGWASNSNVGDGGPGAASNITGAIQYFGAGGAGGKDGGQNGKDSWPTASFGGLGGGGNGTYYNGSGSWIQPTSGLANTGSGGGGTYWCCGNPGAGGSGIVILDVPVPHGRASLYLSSNSGQAGISGSVSHINEFGYKVNSNTPSTIAVSQISDVLRIIKDGTGALSITGVSNFGQDISILAGTLNLFGTNNQVVMNNLVLPTGALLNISNSTGLVVNGTTTIGGNVTSNYDQTYSGVVTLTGSPTFTASNSSKVSFGSAVNDSNFDANNLGLDSVTITGNLSAQSIGAPFINTLGVTQQGIRTISVSGSSQLAGKITTSLGQSFNNVKLTGDVTLKNFSGDISFGTFTQDVSGRHLTLDTPTDKTSLKAINFSQISGISGFVKLNTNTIDINNFGNYSAGSIINNSGILNLNVSGTSIQVSNFAVGNDQPEGATVNLVNAGGPVDLTVGGTFTVGLNSVIAKVNNLIVTGNTILRSNITTAGDQQYNSTDLIQSVRVGANMVLTSTTGNIHFAGGLIEYSNQTNYLKLLDNGNFQYSVAGNVVSGIATSSVTNISGLAIGITYANGQFNVTNSSLNAVSILIVGGGGAGGLGGGGGGGVNLVSTLLAPYTSYIAMIGEGGTRPNDGALPGGNGGNSQFGTLVAIGGGGGGSLYGANYSGCCWMPGVAGGSGGGASFYNWAQGGTGTLGQGFDGGKTTIVRNDTNGYQYWLAGGGGGAGGSPTFTIDPQALAGGWGGNYAANSNSGNGGKGLASNITGTTAYYGGGGGGGTDGAQNAPNSWPTATIGGSGGGGNGAYYSGPNPASGIPANTWIQSTSGAANTGGGGGGSWWCCGAQGTQNGGSGVIVVRQLSTLNINVGLGSSSGIFSAGPSASFQIGSLSVNSNNAFSLSANQIANSTLFTKGGNGALSLSDFSSAFAKSVALIINGGSVVADHGSDTSLVMNSLKINNGSTFDLRTPSLVDLNINSLFMDSGAHLLGLNSLLVNQLASLGVSIITPGSQTYNGSMLLSGDTLIQTTGAISQITMNSTVDDLQAGLSNLVLTVRNSTGAITLNGAIGSTQAIGSLTVNGLATIGTSINTVGDQTYNNDLTLTNTQSVLNNVSMSTVTGNINFNGDVTGFKNTVLEFLGAGNYAINGSIFNASSNPATGISVTYNSNGIYKWNNVDTGNVQLLVVGGGGAGGVGGGGGGGVIATTKALTAGNYDVVVGAGGVAPSDQARPGGNGGDSQFGVLVAVGGGGGGSAWNAAGTICCWNDNPGNFGGSGGGGSYNGWNNGGAGTLGQGYAGGQSVRVRDTLTGYEYWQAGGGGGAGAAPVYLPSLQYSGNTNYAGSGSIGNGGAGYASSITGSQMYYGGGGGGGKGSEQSAPSTYPGASLGGSGGGGNGGFYNGSQWVAQTPGKANTGGGGGGTYWCCADGKYSAGGSGVVILNADLASFSRANLSLQTDSGLITFGASSSLNNIGALSISTNRMTGQTLSTGIVTNTNTTSLIKGGNGVVSISGLSSYSNQITVNGGTLSLTNSPSKTLFINNLVLNGGGLALDPINHQDLTVNNLTTTPGGDLSNANTITVSGSAYLGSTIQSLGEQRYVNDVILWGDTELKSDNANVIFGGNVIGYSANLQFLGNGQYILNQGNTATVGSTSSANLGGGLTIGYNNGQYVFGTQFVGQAQILLVGGGGAGSIGGGGGGGFLFKNNLSLGAGSLYTVIVGAGGLRPNDGALSGGNGGDSQFGSSQFDMLTAVGGGGGGSVYGESSQTCCWVAGKKGGSGGGASFYNWSQGGSGTLGQGNNGGQTTIVYRDPWCQDGCYSYWQAGGGGGAGASPIRTNVANNPWGGTNGSTSNSSGNGGAGLASSITGSYVYYGGGGGGGVDGGQIAPNSWPTATIGGSGGGGNGAYYSGPNPASGIPANTWIQPTAGAANTGGGGGGGWWCCADAKNQSGGSGIIALQIQNTPSLTLNVLNGGSSPIGTTTQFVSLGTLTVNTNTNFTLDATRLDGTQGFIKGGSATLTLTNTNVYSGFIGVSAGTFATPDDGTNTIRLAALKVYGGVFTLVTPQNLVLGGLTIPNSGNLINVLDMTVNGPASLGGTVSTAGSQTYNGPVTITADTIIQTQSSNPISFNSTIDSDMAGFHTLTLYPTITPSGLATIGGNVGNMNPLSSLIINSPSSIGGTTNSAVTGIPDDISINTKGNQTYNGDVRLIGNTSLNTVSGNIYINGNVVGDRSYSTPLEFLGQGRYSYLGVPYIAGGAVPTGPISITVTYDSGTDTYTWFAPYNALVNTLVVGGGGSGGIGGGGGGGVIYSSGIAVNNGQGYTIMVGAGGTNNCCGWTGNNGGNSQFDSVVAIGGGGGGGPYGVNGNGCCWYTGVPGGSGGGNSLYIWNQPVAAGTPGQGYSGGGTYAIGTTDSQGNWLGGGYWQGGGGGGAGGSPSSRQPFVANGYTWGPDWAANASLGNGGPGVASNISGVGVVYYGGGGAGGKDGGQNCGSGTCVYPTASIGGIGGGGNGGFFTGQTPPQGLPYWSWINAANGVANTGGGGGGGGWCCSQQGNGGSGIVIVSIPIAHGRANLSLNSGTGQYFVSGSMTNINTLTLASNSTGNVSGSSGMVWSNHKVTIDGAILSDVQNFTKNGFDDITINNLSNNFGVITVNQGNLTLPPSDANPRQLSYAGLSIASNSHLYIDNVSDLTVTGNTYLGNNLDITGSVNQTYQGTVQIGANITLSASETITFGSTINSTVSNSYGLEVNAPNGISFGDNIGGTNPLAYLTANGPASIPAIVNTFGSQVYKSSVVLNHDTTLTSTGIYAGVYLLGSVEGASSKSQSLTISSKNTYIAGNVGFANQINDLTVTSENIYLFADVRTYRSQTYNGDVWIGDRSNLPSALSALGALATGINGVTSSVLGALDYSVFNYNFRQWHSFIKTSNASRLRTLVSEDPSITFNGHLNDYSSTPTHTLALAAISNNWETPTITFNFGSGDTNRLYSINVQTMWTWDRNTSFGQVNFNGQRMLTKTDQTYRTQNMNSMARNYVPIIDMPPGKLTVLLPNGTFNMQQFGISNGSTAGNVKILITSTASIANLSPTSSVKSEGKPTASSGDTFTGSGKFDGGTSGSTQTGSGSNGGGNQGGSSNQGSGSQGNTAPGSGNGGGNNNSAGNNNGSGSSSGGKTEPPVTLVATNSAPPKSSGSSLGSISLGGIMQSLMASGNSDKSLPSIAGQRSPIGVAVVDVGGIEADDPNFDTKKKK